MLAALWVFSTIGWFWYLAEKRGVPSAFAPLLVFAGQTLVVWLCGLIGVLVAACWALLIGGALLGVWMLFRFGKGLRGWNLPIFAALCILLWLRYRGGLLTQYDDFSHWGLIARHLLTNGALPDASASLIAFQSYPPASACWIGYVCRFLGDSDGMLLTAQAWLTLAALWTLTAFVTKPKALTAVAVGLPMLSALSMFQGTASLMVDNLVAALAIGGVAVAVRGDAKKAPLWCGLTLTVLALTKDSGLFFAAVVLVGLFMLQRRRSATKRALWALGMPLAARLLWWIHLKASFPAAELTRHAMSVENLRVMGADKSYADLLDLGKRLLSQAFRADNQALWVVAAMLLACVLVWLLNGRKRFHGGLLLGSIAVYAAYLVALWGMYGFTMNLETARRLVAFERYNSTCALFLYGALTVWLLRQPLEPRRVNALALAALLLPFALPSWRAGVPRLFAESYFVPMREQMQALCERRPLDPSETATVYIGDDSESLTYAGYMARYQWQRADVNVCSGADISTVQPGGVIYALVVDDALQAAAGDAEIVALP